MSFGELDIIGTIKAFSMNDLLKVRRVVNAAIRAKRPSRPKQGKSKSEAEKRQAKLYAEFREEFCNGPCWNCQDMRGPLDRAHITKAGLGRRLEDDRLVIALCRRCHDAHHEGKLTTANMLWLKRYVQPDRFDWEFLQQWSIRQLPEPVRPDSYGTGF